MNRKNIYLFLCFLGIALPYAEFVPWVAQHGLDMTLFWHQLMANRVSAFFGADVLVSAIVLLVFIRAEGTLHGFQRWLPVIAVLTIGVSLGLPLFLYLREGGRQAEQVVTGPITN